MSINIGANVSDNMLSNAIQSATNACDDIDDITIDCLDGTLGDGDQLDKTGGNYYDVGGRPDANNPNHTMLLSQVPEEYGFAQGTTVDISQASGAMVIDDLMQKISTKVQVASQLLSTANNIAKTASRILSQG